MTKREIEKVKKLFHSMDYEGLKKEGWNLSLCFFEADEYESERFNAEIIKLEMDKLVHSDRDNEKSPKIKPFNEGWLYFYNWEIVKELRLPGDEDWECFPYLFKNNVAIILNRNCSKYYKLIEKFMNTYELFDIRGNRHYDNVVAVRWLGAYWTGAGSADSFEEALNYETSIKDREVSAQAVYNSDESHWIDSLGNKSRHNVENNIYSVLERCKVGILYYQPEIRIVFEGDAYTFQIGATLSDKRGYNWYGSFEEEKRWEESFEEYRAYDEAVLYKEAYPAAIVVRDRLLPENWEVVKKVAEEKGLPIYHVKGKSYFKKQLGIED